MYQNKCCEEKYVDLLLIGEEAKRHYVLIKDFNTFMYGHTLHCGRQHSHVIVFSASSAEEILRRHTKDVFKINGK